MATLPEDAPPPSPDGEAQADLPSAHASARPRPFLLDHWRLPGADPQPTLEPGPAAVLALVDFVPELKPLLDEHLDDNAGQVLCHFFFPYMARFLANEAHACAARGDPPTDAIKRIFSKIEELAVLDDHIKGCVYLSFLDEFDPRDQGYPIVVGLLGPLMRHMLGDIDSRRA